MEHSYSKDIQPKDNVEVMATRTILIPRPPQCPSCHQHNNDDVLAKFDNQQADPYFDQLTPSINDNIAKMAMEETERLTRNVKNSNADDEDWDSKIIKYGWSKQQLNLYRQVSNILDYDQLARLAVSGRQNEGIIRRCSVDKSVSRMRAAFATVHWDIPLTQWLHHLLSDHLPPSYMTSYIDILQTLRAKVPTLVDKMLAAKPVSFNADYMQAVTKRPWGANVPTKQRKLPGQYPVIVVIPSNVYNANQHTPSRIKRWFSLLNTMANVISIQESPRQPSLEHVTEQLVTATRTKIQELRNELPNRHIILVGINAGAAIALQVALVEVVSSIVCMGFAYNTLKGVRGAPDDRILDITIPVLFVLGDNSARSSQEEIESLREKMSAQTSLVVVGSADDALRINKFNRHLEGVTQSVVDNMVADEIQDFISTCILNPPGPREAQKYIHKRGAGGPTSSKSTTAKKRKHKDSLSDPDGSTPRKVGRPRLNKTNEISTGKFRPERPKPTSALLKQNNESLKMAIQNILPPNETPPMNLMSTDDDTTFTSTPTIAVNTSDLNGSQTFEVVTTPADSSSVQVTQAASTTTNTITTSAITGPVKILNTASPFVQLKPPTTTGRVQSPGVKNFFIRKGVEKKATTQSYYTVRTQPTIGEIVSPSLSSSANDKKIIIKSQQIIKPANTMPSNSGVANISNTSATDLSNILDLPILFADSDGNLQEQSAMSAPAPIIITSTSTTTATIGTAATVPTDSSAAATTTTSTSAPTNVLITSPDGKLPNRAVVISTAGVTKLTKPSSPSGLTFKIVYNERKNNERIENLKSMSQLKVFHQDRQDVKTMPPIKLVTQGQTNTTTSLVGTGAFTKLVPGTKLKILNSGASPSTSGNIAFKTANVQQRDSPKNFVLRAATGTSNVFNPNMMPLRKLVNIVPSSRSTNSTAGPVNGTGTTTIVTPSSSTQSSPAKTDTDTSNTDAGAESTQ